MQNLYYEFSAALFLLAAAASAVLFARRRTIISAILTGCLWGALTLTKAVGLYLSFAAIPLLAVSLFFFKQESLKRAGVLCAALALAYAAVVTPWMVRNYAHFNQFSICQRGGSVLLTRAYKNQMTISEMYGASYAYAPLPIRRLLERALGFDPHDIETGGKYQRLMRTRPGDLEAIAAGDPDAAISYFAKSGAVKARLIREYQAQGKTIQDADAQFQKMGLEMIKAAPLKHLATIPVFAYRGIWSFRVKLDRVLFGQGSEVAVDSSILLGISASLLNLAAFLALLAMPCVAIYARKPDWFACSLFGAGFFWFYACFTHFLARYSAALIPLTLIALLTLLHSGARRVVSLMNITHAAFEKGK